jgi:hypothetical protein
MNTYECQVTKKYNAYFTHVSKNTTVIYSLSQNFYLNVDTITTYE